MISILQSIKPQYCELIAAGLKGDELRKTKPECPTPFKVYIYQSKHKWVYKILERLGLYQGKVIGEYVCNEITEYLCKNVHRDSEIINTYDIPQPVRQKLCLSYEEICKCGNGDTLRDWHISNLKIYDKPRELSEFFKACDKPRGTDCSVCIDNREQICKSLIRPPQSWCYVEEIEQ